MGGGAACVRACHALSGSDESESESAGSLAGGELALVYGDASPTCSPSAELGASDMVEVNE